MSSTIVQYAGIVIDDVAVADSTYSSIQGDWNRTAQLWDDGISRYIFWGDTTGQVTFFDLQLTQTGDCDCALAIADYSTSQTISLYQGYVGAAHLVITLSGCYSFGLTSSKLKLIGDTYVIEGGTTYQIFA